MAFFQWKNLPKIRRVIHRSLDEILSFLQINKKEIFFFLAFRTSKILQKIVQDTG